MQPPVRIVVSLILLTSALATYQSSAKLRRDGVLNLYPFPRVGRASTNTWLVPLNEHSKGFNHGELPIRDPIELTDSNVPGMWFGPRVGRSFTQEEKYEPVEKRQLYAFPRVGRRYLPRELLHREFQRTRRLDSVGTWFGPRLDRTFKRDDDGFNHGDQPIRDPLQLTDGNGPGMWFGPRVGRSFTDDESIRMQNENLDHSEPEQTEPVQEERKKRQAKLM